MANTSFNTSGTIISGSGSTSGSYAGFTILQNATFTGLRDINQSNQIIGIINYTASLTFTSAQLTPFISPSGSFNVNGVILAITGSPAPANTSTTIFITGSTPSSNTVNNIVNVFNFSSSVSPYSTLIRFITASTPDNASILFSVSSSVSGALGNSYYLNSGSDTLRFTGGVSPGASSSIFAAGTTIPLYTTSASISAGTVLFYPISTFIPQA